MVQTNVSDQTNKPEDVHLIEMLFVILAFYILLLTCTLGLVIFLKLFLFYFCF